MGKGDGFELNLDTVLKIVGLVLLIVAIVCFLQDGDSFSGLAMYHSYMQSYDALNISAGIYIIILGVMLLLKLIKGLELDEKFVGVVSAVGTILLLASGIAVCVDYGDDNRSRAFTGGILGICGAVALCVDALKDFGVF